MQNVINKAYSALLKTNEYFVDLQNRYALLPHEERIWASVSEAISRIEKAENPELMDTQTMLIKLSKSANHIVASKCNKIISGETTIENELKCCGSFFKAVLLGYSDLAVMLADTDNFYALTGKTK